MRGEITEERANQLPSSIAQGAVVQLFAGTSDPIWEGRLAAPAHVTNGVAHVAASGHKTRLEKEDERLLFQTRDYGLWQTVGSEPFEPFGTQEDVEAEARRAALMFKASKDVAYSSGDSNGVAIWVPGATISRYAFDVVANRTSVNFDVRSRRFTGPAGSRNTVADHALSSTTFSVAQNVSSAEDALVLLLRANGASTPANNLIVRIKNLRAYGIATSDTYLAYQAMQHAAGLLSFDSAGISTSLDLNCLPLDWQDSWASLFDYLAMLEDGWWRVLDDRGSGPYVEANTWANSTTWTCAQAEGARLDLTPSEKFNKVQVNYFGLNGAPRRVRATASPDPLASIGISNVYEETIEDPQANSTLAETVRDALLAVVSTDSYTGTIEVAKARDEAGREAIHEIRAGDKVTVSDWAMGESFTHRIHDVEYRADGVTLGIEGPVNPTAAILEVAGLKQARKRHPVRKRKGRRNRK